jgi:tetratricopeptide (TPR) repeat protein
MSTAPVNPPPAAPRRDLLERVFTLWVALLVLILVVLLLAVVGVGALLHQQGQRIADLERTREDQTKALTDVTRAATQALQAARAAQTAAASVPPTPRAPVSPPASPPTNTGRPPTPAPPTSPAGPAPTSGPAGAAALSAGELDAMLSGALRTSARLGAELADAAAARTLYTTRIRPQLATAWPAPILARLAVLALLLNERAEADELVERAEAGGEACALYYEVLARRALAAGPDADALTPALVLAQRTGQSAVSRVLAARAYVRRSAPGSAAEALEPASALAGLSPSDELALGPVYVATEQWPALTALLAHVPPPTDAADTATRQFLQAALAVATGPRETLVDAMGRLDYLHGRSGADYDVNLWRGRALERVGQRQAAAAEYQRLLDLDPNRPEARCRLGVLDLNAGNTASARIAFQDALLTAPEYTFAWEGVGAAALNGSDMEGGLAALRRAVQSFPRRARSHLLLALALAKDGVKDAAAAELRQTFALDATLLSDAQSADAVAAMFTRAELDALLPGATTQPTSRPTSRPRR